uniref:Uncharacterized protein n=1 Tax=Anguilla anguilla TaxID=7936 RepID=A0A0E9U4S9_ANGAN
MAPATFCSKPLTQPSLDPCQIILLGQLILGCVNQYYKLWQT